MFETTIVLILTVIGITALAIYRHAKYISISTQSIARKLKDENAFNAPNLTKELKTEFEDFISENETYEPANDIHKKLLGEVETQFD